MSEWWLGFVVGFGLLFALNSVAALIQMWLRRRARRRLDALLAQGRSLMDDPHVGLGRFLGAPAPPPWPAGLAAGVIAEGTPRRLDESLPPHSSTGRGQLSGLEVRKLEHDLGGSAAPDAAVPEDPRDWSHVWAYVNGFERFVDLIKDTILQRATPEEYRAACLAPRDMGTEAKFRYDGKLPEYVGHPRVERWLLDFFASQVVQGFERDGTYTLDEVSDDIQDCRAQLDAMLIEVGPPRTRSVAARLQAQIADVKRRADRDAADRRSVREIQSTFGQGSFGGDPQPESGPMD